MLAHAGEMAVQSWNRNRAVNFVGPHWLRLPLVEQGEFGGYSNCYESKLPRAAYDTKDA